MVSQNSTCVSAVRKQPLDRIFCVVVPLFSGRKLRHVRAAALVPDLMMKNRSETTLFLASADFLFSPGVAVTPGG